MSEKIIHIDSRVVGFSDTPMRMMATCFSDTGEIYLSGEAKFTINNDGIDVENTVIVTDSPEYVRCWQLSFDAKTDLEQVITLYQNQNRAGLILLDKSLERYNPRNVLQVRKLDKNGLQQEFDSSQVNNGHVAILLAVWASAKVAQHDSVYSPSAVSDVDHTLLPFSI